jgi:hypothetical protein
MILAMRSASIVCSVLLLGAVAHAAADAPAIDSFAPTTGAPGAKVKIFGAHFTPKDAVLYGRTPLKIGARSDTFLEVTIPPTAITSETLTVIGPTGAKATTTQQFALVFPPSITRFTPTAGGPGMRVTISGAHFQKTDEVRFDGHKLPLATFTEQSIAVDIPADAHDDYFTIDREGDDVAVSKTKFTVLAAPILTSFSPTGGPGGTKVTLTGTGFTPDAAVTFGKIPLRIVARTADTSLDVVIPAGAKSDTLTITTRGGKVSTPQPFQVHVYSTITAVTPLAGSPGTKVTIKGTHFEDGGDTFFLGDVKLPIIDKGGGAYVVAIPPAAKTGPIIWQSWEKKQTSRFTFTITVPPMITAIAPRAGAVGTHVTIAGLNFTDTATVLFGTSACKIIRRNLPSSIVVEIPAGSEGSDFLWIESSGKRYRSPSSFQVLDAPIVTSVDPQSGPVGEQVTITGANFTDAVRVLFDAKEATIVSNEANKLVVLVPDGLRAGAKSTITLQGDEGTKPVKAATPFTIVVVPVVKSIAPRTGAPGAEVTITGDNFTPTTMVYFGSTPCTIVKRSGKTQIVVSLPADASGTGKFMLEDGDQRVTSDLTFEVKK